MTIVIWAVVAVVASIGTAGLQVDTSTASFLDRTSPEWQTYLRSIERHGGDEFIVVALQSPKEWDVANLRSVERLSKKLEMVPGVRRVDSLASVPLIRNEHGTLVVDTGLAGGIPESPRGLREFIHNVERDRLALDSLVSRDGRVFAINLLVENGEGTNWASLVESVRGLAEAEGARVTGVPVFRTEVNARMSEELNVFVPATLVLLALSILLVVPSPSAIVAPLSVSGAAVLCALGAMGFSTVSLSLATMLLPSTLLALGSAYGIHIVAARGNIDSISAVAFPVALSGLTTTIGFVAMAAVPISAIRELAIFGAVGVVAGTLAALTLAPAVLSLYPISGRGSRSSNWIRSSLAISLCRLVESHRGWVIGIWLALIGLGCVGLARLEISTDIVKWFSPSSEVRRDYEDIRQRLSGISPANVFIEARSESAPDVDSAEIVARIDKLSSYLVADEDIGKSISIGDPLRLVRRAFKGEGEDSLPQSNSEIQQSLLLLSGMDRLEDVLHDDRRTANILLRLDNNSSDDIIGLEREVKSWWNEYGDDRYQVAVTGIMYEFARSEEEIAHGQLQGLALASISIAAVLLIVLRRPRVAGIAFVANIAPIAIGFGALGLLNIPLDAGTVCVSSMALGIAVDDTIHVVTSYRVERSRAAVRKDALQVAFQKVLPALLVTTLAISVGFVVLSLSDFTLVRNLGFVTAALVVLCLASDITLLPAMLLRASHEGD